MNGKQKAVLWLGLLLIIVRLVTTSQGQVLWATLTGGLLSIPSGKGTAPFNGKTPNSGIGIPTPPNNGEWWYWFIPGLGPL